MSDEKKLVLTSLSLRIGLAVFDGGDRGWIAKTFAVSLDDVDASWLQCRTWLSKHFANVEKRDYELLDEPALRDRLEDSLRQLIDWRSTALQDELLGELTYH